ncbi:TonB family protein [Burkholderia sp. BCC1988]|uniref:TonB family protein n=1 Tax=Burkholderia sp. BCC1988 TaxID=2817443 RepID=UPI002AB2E41D|nr:TonB family protein [Burkholderia sp. BCC1988]
MAARDGAAIASREEWMPAGYGAIRVNHCQIAATREAARAQCAKAFACMAARSGLPARTLPPDLREPAKQDRDRATIGRAAATGRRSDGRGAGRCTRCGRTMSAGAAIGRNSTQERYSTMALRSTILILPAVAVLLSGCAMLSSSQESKLTCRIPRAVYPDGAKPLTRPVTVLVRALMTTSGEAQNVTVTTSSRNAAADRAAVDAMTHATCAQTGATANPFLLTQPFVFEPRRGE